MGSSEAILAQEKEGARQFRDSDVIPRRRDRISNEQLLKLGFKLGGNVEDDELFQYASLPPGWTRKETGHDMWTRIVDEKGRERFSVFYKAAFYDRSAHMSGNVRYGYRTNYDAPIATVEIRDGDTVIQSFTKEVKNTSRDKDNNEANKELRSKYYDALTECEEHARRWLETHKPQYSDWTAYWDD